MSDALRLSRAVLDDDADGDLLSPLCRSIVDGTYKEKPRPSRDDDDRAQLLAEISALTQRIGTLEKRIASRKLNKRDTEILAEAIGKCLGEAIKPLKQRLDELEKRSTGTKWAGTWHDGMRCAEGELVTDRGSLWLCTASSNDRPGDNASAFRLIVKNGHADNGARRHVQTAIRS